MFKIGEFSRLSRVSVRMLRHYDQLGLLKPIQIDESTNYRYYTAAQLPHLNRILALRDLGFSLEQIRSMLEQDSSPGELLGMYKLKRAEIEQQLAFEQDRLERLEARIAHLNTNSSPQPYDVVIREVPFQLMATLREIAVDDDRIQYMFEEVEAYVRPFEARADLPPLTIYHDPEYRDENIDAEVAVPLTHAIPGTHTIHVRQLEPLKQAACVVHTGSYATIDRAYNALLDWIETHGYRLHGSVREVYLNYSANGLGFDLPPTYLVQGAASFVTELQLGIERA